MAIKIQRGDSSRMHQLLDLQNISIPTLVSYCILRSNGAVSAILSIGRLLD